MLSDQEALKILPKFYKRLKFQRFTAKAVIVTQLIDIPNIFP